MNRRIFALCLTLILLCPACSWGHTQMGTLRERQYSVYFLTDQNQLGRKGRIPTQEFRVLPSDMETVEGLIQILLAGPASPFLRSPFLEGTTLRDWHLEDGLLTIDLSEAYGDLLGVDVTLADACITLTLCQLEEVDRVYLMVEGKPRPVRDQILEPGQFLLNLEPMNELE